MVSFDPSAPWMSACGLFHRDQRAARTEAIGLSRRIFRYFTVGTRGRKAQ